jgi:predicted phosphodiesterase
MLSAKSVLFFIILLGVVSLGVIVHATSDSDSSQTTYCLSEASTTPIPQNLPWYFTLVFGDNRPSDTNSLFFPEPFYDFVKTARTTDPFAVIGTGDHTGRGLMEQINRFVEAVVGIENFWVIEGNHDLESGGDYWRSVVAPSMYYRDGFPGWRIVFFSSEVPYGEYGKVKNFLEQALNTSRNVILVYHRPIYPKINYNMDTQLSRIVLEVINKYGNVRLALQGHWHGFAEQKVGNTTFIITAGSGAPLYQSGGVHHYLYLILYPNGTIHYTPIMIKETIKVYLREGGLTVENLAEDIGGEAVSHPIRIKIMYNHVPVYIVALAPPGNTTFTYKIKNNTITVNADRNLEWYLYIPTYPKAILNATQTSTKTLKIPSIGLITEPRIIMLKTLWLTTVTKHSTVTTTTTSMHAYTTTVSTTTTTTVFETITSKGTQNKASTAIAVLLAAIAIAVAIIFGRTKKSF